jgi:DNA-directed RNA polymerase alpha subunit
VASDASLPPETPIDALNLSARRYKLLTRADIQRLGELVLFTEAGFLGLRHARATDWTAIQQALRHTGIDRASVPLVYLIGSPSVLTLLFHQEIRRVGDLLSLTNAELRGLPGMSPADVDEVQRALAHYGLTLRA